MTTRGGGSTRRRRQAEPDRRHAGDGRRRGVCRCRVHRDSPASRTSSSEGSARGTPSGSPFRLVFMTAGAAIEAVRRLALVAERAHVTEAMMTLDGASIAVASRRRGTAAGLGALARVRSPHVATTRSTRSARRTASSPSTSAVTVASDGARRRLHARAARPRRHRRRGRARASRRFDYCGLSIGGLIGQWLGLQRRRPPPLADALQHRRQDQRGRALERAHRRRPHAGHARTRRRGDRAVVHPRVRRTPIPRSIERFRSQLLATDPEGYAGCCAAIRGADLRDDVHGIATRTLLVAGTGDVATPPEQSDILHAQIKGSQRRLLEAGHLSNVEQADAFTDAVAGFLA